MLHVLLGSSMQASRYDTDVHDLTHSNETHHTLGSYVL